MLRTSVLERLCAPLCDAVLAQAGSADALDSLARSNLFLIPLDDGRRWFRFHHLFAQILRVELERREPAIVPALHRRASAWHAEQGTTDEAIHHAVAAKAYPEAGPADRRDVGALRQRRTHLDRRGLAPALPRGGARRRRAAARGQGLALGAARPRGRHARGDGPRARAGRPRRGPAAGRLHLARVEPVRAQRHVRLGRRVGDPRARHALGAPGRPGLAVAAGDHVGAGLGASTAPATSTRPSAG